MSLAGIKDEQARLEIRRLRSEIKQLRNLLSGVIQNGVISITQQSIFDGSDLYAMQSSKPTANADSPVIWVNNGSLPWRAALKLKNSSGSYDYYQVAEAP